jgi:hypothetical protein
MILTYILETEMLLTRISLTICRVGTKTNGRLSKLLEKKLPMARRTIRSSGNRSLSLKTSDNPELARTLVEEFKAKARTRREKNINRKHD